MVVQENRSLFGWFRGTVFVDEVRCLSTPCAYVPLDLRLDGRLIDRDPWCRFPGEFGDHLGLPARFLFVERVVPDKEGFPACFLTVRDCSQPPFRQVGAAEVHACWQGAARGEFEPVPNCGP